MKNAPTNRQLKVGELIRHTLSTFFMRGELPLLDGTPITVSEVRISPDLKNATAYIYPLGGQNMDKVMDILIANLPYIRHYVTKDINLRASPRISFKIDHSYDHAARISQLLNQISQ